MVLNLFKEQGLLLSVLFGELHQFFGHPFADSFLRLTFDAN